MQLLLRVSTIEKIALQTFVIDVVVKATKTKQFTIPSGL